MRKELDKFRRESLTRANAAYDLQTQLVILPLVRAYEEHVDAFERQLAEFCKDDEKLRAATLAAYEARVASELDVKCRVKKAKLKDLRS